MTAGEGENAQEIELADDPQHLIVFHHWKCIEIVFQEQAKALGRAYTKAVADAVNPLPKAG